MRKRDEEFADNVVAAVQHVGALNDESLVMAADATYEPVFAASPAKHKALMLRKAKSKMRKPDVRERIRAVFELADFSVMDAVQMHVAHIRGTAPEKASYQALKDFEAMAFEQAPKTLNVNNRNLNLNMTPGSGRDEAPPIAPRILGAAKVEE